jgi:hypothetical protein
MAASRVRGSLAAALAAAALAAAWVATASSAATSGDDGETLNARAISMRGGPGPNTGVLIVHIDRYTTDEELAADVEAFRAGGQEAVVTRWQKEKPVVGRARFAQTLGIDVRVARSRPTPTGRHITLATDRRIGGVEVMRNLRSEDYPIGWIEADVDTNGKGEGRLVPAVKLTVKDGALVIESYGNEPLRLVSVTVKKK